MARPELEHKVNEQFGMTLGEFIKQKVELGALYDYEIAAILNVNIWDIITLRNSFGISKRNVFSKRFERTYGKGAVNIFKKMIENPENCLADVARHFGYSREYARYVYNKIYGCSYAEEYRRKRKIKKIKRLADRKEKSKRLRCMMQVSEKMKSMGIISNISDGAPYMILTNGHKLALKSSSRPVMINGKQYYRFAKGANSDVDFFVCLCRKENEDIHFIIPADAMPRSAIFLLPQAAPSQSKHACFREAWHQLAPDNS